MLKITTPSIKKDINIKESKEIIDLNLKIKSFETALDGKKSLPKENKNKEEDYKFHKLTLDGLTLFVFD